MKILLDTTALIDLMKSDQKVIQVIERIRSDHQMYTTTINLYEIMRGIKLLNNPKNHLQAVRLLEQNLSILFLDADSAENASDIYVQLRKKGIEINEADNLIAGIARSNGIDKILTRNEKHFRNIEKLQVVTY